jgi:hypothetical protein
VALKQTAIMSGPSSISDLLDARRATPKTIGSTLFKIAFPGFQSPMNARHLPAVGLNGLLEVRRPWICAIAAPALTASMYCCATPECPPAAGRGLR